MSSDETKQISDPLGIMACEIHFPIPEEPFSEGLPQKVKRYLWNYALGISTPEEEEQVGRWLAVSQRIQEELVRIRHCMKEAGLPCAIEEEAEPMPSVLRSVWDQVSQWLAELPGLVSSLGAMVVDTAEGLWWSQQGPGMEWDLSQVGQVVVPAPVMLDLAKPPKFPPLIEFRSRHGVSVVVNRIGHGNLHLKVSVAGVSTGETVRLFEMVQTAQGVESRQFGDTVPLQEGQAEFPECPPGLWKIVVSDGRELYLFIAQQQK